MAERDFAFGCLHPFRVVLDKIKVVFQRKLDRTDLKMTAFLRFVSVSSGCLGKLVTLVDAHRPLKECCL